MTFACLPACNGARWCGGLFVNDSATNPLTHDWNKVLLPYHDGQSFTGDVAEPVWTTYGGAGVPLYFRGKRNFLAAVDYLQKLGMGGAQEVALTGNSAGGLATFYHADALAALLPGARVWAAPDSGYFIADVPGYPAWAAGLRAMVAMANSTSALNANCLSAVAGAGGDPATCAYPEVLAPYIQTPLFVVNGRYDPALTSIAGGEGGRNASHVREIGRLLLANIQASVLRAGSGNAAFVSACAEHCGQWAQGSDGDFNVTIGALQAIPALTQWRAGAAPGKLWVQAPGDTFPCADCCRGGQGAASAAAASAAAPPCHASFNNETQLETPCYAVVRRASAPSGGALELRRYAGAAATVVEYNLSASVTTYQEALNIAGFYVIAYFQGDNQQNKSLLASRTVPFTLHPPSATRDFWLGRMALAPSQWPAHSQPPATNENNGTPSLAALGKGAFLVASLRKSFQETPQPSDLDELCASLNSSLGLLGGALDPASVYSPTHAYYFGRADILNSYDAECWLGVTAAKAAGES